MSDSPAEDSVALLAWRDSQRQQESDPDGDLSQLVIPLGRLLGWLSEGETVERLGMRIAVVLYIFRPDLLGAKSLREISGTSKQNVDKLVTDFRGTFGLRQTPHQLAKRA